eukprot:2889278-Rhodomonas_salina.2
MGLEMRCSRLACARGDLERGRGECFEMGDEPEWCWRLCFAVHVTNPVLKDKNPQLQHNLYQKCGFLYSISGCTQYQTPRCKWQG